jgi:hypothetical protein
MFDKTRLFDGRALEIGAESISPQHEFEFKELPRSEAWAESDERLSNPSDSSPSIHCALKSATFQEETIDPPRCPNCTSLACRLFHARTTAW